jgi:chorismate mutase
MRALAEFRDQINELDHRLIQLLGERMEVAEKIGRYKKDNGMAVLQPQRWETMMKTRLETGNRKGLNEVFMTTLFRFIHQESIHRQRCVMNQCQKG